jgi:hypothetical protein
MLLIHTCYKSTALQIPFSVRRKGLGGLCLVQSKMSDARDSTPVNGAKSPIIRLMNHI